LEDIFPLALGADEGNIILFRTQDEEPLRLYNMFNKLYYLAITGLKT
jgi:hypothetical protein